MPGVMRTTQMETFGPDARGRRGGAQIGGVGRRTARYGPCKNRATRRAGLSEEARDQRPVAVHVDEERVVALERVQLDELDFTPRGTESLRELALLIDREQEVRRDADDQRTLHADLPEADLDGAAMLGDVEQVARAREVQIAVRVELPGELVRMVLEIRLD